MRGWNTLAAVIIAALVAPFVIPFTVRRDEIDEGGPVNPPTSRETASAGSVHSPGTVPSPTDYGSLLYAMQAYRNNPRALAPFVFVNHYRTLPSSRLSALQDRLFAATRLFGANATNAGMIATPAGPLALVHSPAGLRIDLSIQP